MQHMTDMRELERRKDEQLFEANARYMNYYNKSEDIIKELSEKLAVT